MSKPVCIILMTIWMLSLSSVFSRRVVPRTIVTDEEYFQMPDLFHLDKFDECISLKDKGLYCTALIQLEPTGSNNSLWKIIQKVIANPYNYRHDRLRHGICLPLTCPKLPQAQYRTGFNDTGLMKAISGCYTEKYRHLGLRSHVESVECQNHVGPVYDVGFGGMLFVWFIGVLLSIIIICTYIEGRARYKSEEEYTETMNNKPLGRLIICFSLANNWQRLRQDNLSADGRKLAFIQGIRFFNMFFVIMSHTGLVRFLGSVNNPRFLETASTQPDKMFLFNGSHIIQTNFVIGGWLLMYNIMGVYEKKGAIKGRQLVMMFVNRYIRITPTLFICLWFSVTWLPLTANGPYALKFAQMEYVACRESWWSFILQINNNFYTDQAMCMQHTWYLACDTQLFAIALCVLPFVLKYPKHAAKILILMILLGITLTFAHAYFGDIDIVTRMTPEMIQYTILHTNEFHAMLISTHSNISGYFIGMLFGYWYYTYLRNVRVLTTKLSIGLWYFLFYVPILSTILVAFLFYQDGFEYSQTMVALNQSMSRVIFALAIACGMVGFADGQGWFGKWLLNWSPLQVLGRLSFTAYVVHIILIRLRHATARETYYLSVYNIMSDSMADFTVTYLVATVVCLCVELPISALQNLAMDKKQVKPMENTKKEN